MRGNLNSAEACPTSMFSPCIQVHTERELRYQVVVALGWDSVTSTYMCMHTQHAIAIASKTLSKALKEVMKRIQHTERNGRNEVTVHHVQV
jgi:hypothetical protein